MVGLSKKKENVAKIPTPSRSDVAHTIARAGISAIPVVGGPAVELFSAVVVPPLNKRRDEWVQSIGTRLMELEGKVDGFSIDDLSKNEVFITTVTHATTVAIRNHHKEKLKALRNAVINSALPNSPGEDLQLMFINFIDSLTPWHLKILFLLHDQMAFREKYGIKCKEGTIMYITDAIPELKNQEEFLTLIMKDLQSHGLIPYDPEESPLWIGGFADAIPAPKTTKLGDQFFAFITSN